MSFTAPSTRANSAFEGTATAGPALKSGSLPRYGISKDDKGHVMVDCTKEFSESKWDDTRQLHQALNKNLNRLIEAPDADLGLFLSSRFFAAAVFQTESRAIRSADR